MGGAPQWQCCPGYGVVPSIPTNCTAYFSNYNLPARSIATGLSAYNASSSKGTTNLATVRRETAELN
jgi:hypothetical protein